MWYSRWKGFILFEVWFPDFPISNFPIWNPNPNPHLRNSFLYSLRAETTKWTVTFSLLFNCLFTFYPWGSFLLSKKNNIYFVPILRTNCLGEEKILTGVWQIVCEFSRLGVIDVKENESTSPTVVSGDFGEGSKMCNWTFHWLKVTEEGSNMIFWKEPEFCVCVWLSMCHKNWGNERSHRLPLVTKLV